ncbi:Glutathione S-transferase-1 [Aphelenchoides besseyi]|nr:Glutathione S-transferase-1 [Aphelenchoides besseyi]
MSGYQRILSKGIERERLRKEQFLPAIEKYLPQIEDILRNYGSGFYARSGLSWIAFYVAEARKLELSIRTIKDMEDDSLKKYSLILNHSPHFYHMPEPKAYLNKRGLIPY